MSSLSLLGEAEAADGGRRKGNGGELTEGAEMSSRGCEGKEGIYQSKNCIYF